MFLSLSDVLSSVYPINEFSDKVKVQEDSLSNLNQEIINLKKELSLTINKTNEKTSNVLHITAISYYDDMEDRYSDGWYDDERNFYFNDLPGNNDNDKYNVQTNELINGTVYNFYNNPFSDFNGYVKCEYNFKYGKLHGLVSFYDDYKGKYFLSNSIEYRNGKRNGFYRRWHENGQLCEETNYKEGKKNGKHFRWWENGQLKEEALFFDGKVNGEFFEYFNNGNLRFTGMYVNKKPIGVQKAWWENGNIEFERHFFEEYNDLYKELDSTMSYVFHGLFKRWYENGKDKSEIHYIKGIKDGVSSYFYESGLLESKETYKNGVLISQQCWDEEGYEIDCK